jgi:hypothetical protein
VANKLQNEKQQQKEPYGEDLSPHQDGEIGFKQQ